MDSFIMFTGIPLHLQSYLVLCTLYYTDQVHLLPLKKLRNDELVVKCSMKGLK